MSVTVKVNGSSNSLVHKGSNGIANSTVPDVCKTPSPGGPVPIPYPVIVSMSSDLANGSTTVTADGGNMIAIKGCEFSRCTGDEPGTVGGVKSSTFMQEAKFILYSFDVKIDGQNACRLTDKMTMNHENTVCLGGVLQIPVIPQGTAEQMIACAIHCCDKAKYDKRDHKDEGQDCRSLSTSKHSCVMHSLRNSKEAKAAGISASPSNVKGAAGQTLIPDTMFGDRIIDAKFPCKKKVPAPLKSAAHESDLTVPGTDMLTDKELIDYPSIKNPKINKVEAMTPKDAASKKSDDCKCTYKPKT